MLATDLALVVLDDEGPAFAFKLLERALVSGTEGEELVELLGE